MSDSHKLTAMAAMTGAILAIYIVNTVLWHVFGR